MKYCFIDSKIHTEWSTNDSTQNIKFLSGHVYQIPELPWKPIQSIQHCNSGTNCARAKPFVPIGSLYPTSYSLVILFDTISQTIVA